MFGRDDAVDPVAEAAKLLAASKAHAPASSTEFAREMLDKAPPPHAPAKAAKPGRTITPEQLAALRRFEESQKAVREKIGKGGAWIPRIIVTLVVLFILRDMIPDVIAFVKSLIAAGAP